MVTITGEVASADGKSRVEHPAKVAPGVKDVANGLEIKAGAVSADNPGGESHRIGKIGRIEVRV